MNFLFLVIEIYKVEQKSEDKILSIVVLDLSLGVSLDLISDLVYFTGGFLAVLKQCEFNVDVILLIKHL